MDPQTDQIDQTGSIQTEQHALLAAQPVRSLEQEDNAPAQQHDQSTVYVEDWWERLPVSRKTALVAFIVFILVAIAPFSGKPVIEFLVTVALALFVGLITLNQYYIAKRQWFVMERGLKSTQGLLRQNDQMVAAMQSQVDLSEDALKHADEALEFNQTSFYLAERAYLSIRNLTPGFFAPGRTAKNRQLVVNADPKFGFEIVNGGRTPAFDVTAVVYTAISDTVPQTVAEWTPSRDEMRADFVMPGGEPVNFVSRGNVHPTDEYDDMWSGRLETLYYFVKIELSYWDISGGNEPQLSTYIFTYDRDRGVIETDVQTDVLLHRIRTKGSTGGDDQENQNPN